MKYKLDDSGFEMIPSILDQADLELLRKAFDNFHGVRTEQNGEPGYRQVMNHVPEVRALAQSPKIAELLTRIAGVEGQRGAYFPVRSLFFDKTDDANWLVPWHQDISIAVNKRLDIPGFGPWSVKQGVVHVTPPEEILRTMLTIRLHLDDCDATNGALQVIPGSHQWGRLDSARIADHKTHQKHVVCWCQSGDALIMRRCCSTLPCPPKSIRIAESFIWNLQTAICPTAWNGRKRHRKATSPPSKRTISLKNKNSPQSPSFYTFPK